MVVTADVLSGTATDVHRMLEDCRTTVVPELRASVRRLPDPLRRVAGYHFGWTATLVAAAGGQVWARQEAERHVSEALTCLHASDPAPQAAADLIALAGLITHRDR